jgi:hypothetical protein
MLCRVFRRQEARMSKPRKPNTRKAGKQTPTLEADVAYGPVCRPGQTIAPDLNAFALDEDGHTHAYVRLRLPLEPGCAVALLGRKKIRLGLYWPGHPTQFAEFKDVWKQKEVRRPTTIPLGATAVRLVGISRSAEQMRGGDHG